MKHLLFSILCLALVSCQQVSSNEYSLKYVQDGDSLVVCCDKQNKTFIVRLNDIDAPEKRQPFAKESRAYLENLIKGKAFKLVGKKYDRYGRLLADIMVDEKSVNTQMINSGHAWLWRYSDNLKLQWLQRQAKKDQKGLWALPESQRIEPWKWRKKNFR